MNLKEITEGRLKNSAIDAEFDKQHSTTKAKFAVMVNGKIWKRNGTTVEFRDYSAARNAADKITASKNITTQVVPI
jgi:hypothetical protein